MNRNPIIKSIARTTTPAVALAALLALPAGCSSTPASSPATGSSLQEINPAIAYAQRNHQEAMAHYTTASQLHLDGKDEQALGEYRQALELDNKVYPAWNNMGELLMSQGNYADAVSAFEIASGIEPADPRPEYNIGVAYQKVGWAKDSFTHFETALERDPNYLPALRGLIRSAEMLDLGNEQILGSIRNAQLRETDEQWRSYFSTQYDRVKAMLKN